MPIGIGNIKMITAYEPKPTKLMGIIQKPPQQSRECEATAAARSDYGYIYKYAHGLRCISSVIQCPLSNVYNGLGLRMHARMIYHGY